MFKVDFDALRDATGLLLLPSPGQVEPYLSRGRWHQYADRAKKEQSRRKKPAVVPAHPPRGRGVALGPGSPAAFVRLEYDGSSGLTLSATDGHLVTTTQVGVKPTGEGRPWVHWTPWWKWVWTVNHFPTLTANVRPTPAGGYEFSFDLRRRQIAVWMVGRYALPGPAPGHSPAPGTEVVPQLTAERGTKEIDCVELSRVLRLFAKAAWPGPRYRTELALDTDGLAGITNGHVTWTASTRLQLPFVFSPANPGLRAACRWICRVSSGLNPVTRVVVTRAADAHGRVFYRLTDPARRHALVVPEGRGLDRPTLEQFTSPGPRIPGPEFRLRVAPLRLVADATRRWRSRAEVALDVRPAGVERRGGFRIRGLGAGVETGGGDPPDGPNPEGGWSVVLPARFLLSAVAPFRGAEVVARPLGRDRLVLTDLPRPGGLAITATVKCQPPQSDSPEPGTPTLADTHRAHEE